MNSNVIRVDLTGYLTTLAVHVGYQVNLDELGPACAQHPELVLAWAAAGGRHATLSYTRRLLEAPARYMRDGEGDETGRMYVAMLHQLYQHDEQLEAAIEQAAREYTTACANLATADTGLTYPYQPGSSGGRAADPPAGVRGLRHIRIGDTIIEITSSPGGTVLHCRGSRHDWQATFTASTPTRVVNTALAAAVATADPHHPDHHTQP